jgi:hypothetical protein
MVLAGNPKVEFIPVYVPMGLTGAQKNAYSKIVIGFNIKVLWDKTLVLWQSGAKVQEKNSALIFRENGPREIS